MHLSESHFRDNASRPDSIGAGAPGHSSSSDGLTRNARASRSSTSTEGAIEKLARRLHWTMERFDPSDNERESEWDTLTQTEREFYRASVRELFLERQFVLAALG